MLFGKRMNGQLWCSLVACGRGTVDGRMALRSLLVLLRLGKLRAPVLVATLVARCPLLVAQSPLLLTLHRRLS